MEDNNNRQNEFIDVLNAEIQSLKNPGTPAGSTNEDSIYKLNLSSLFHTSQIDSRIHLIRFV